jgi:FdrA protein
MLTEIESVRADDLVIVVLADNEEAAARALHEAEGYLVQRSAAAESGQASRPRSIRAAARSASHPNLAVISVAGQFAAAEAWEALKAGLHVLLFSDNVPLADEVALKRHASERGLLLMGPGCGTAIINGVALGFANAVPRGPVGIVAAAGTGLQEVSSLLAKLGVGISQAIGTGGRDLKEEVGGITMLQGLRALQADPATEVLLLVSKLPAPAIAGRVLEQVRASTKPTVVCFLGAAIPPASGATVPARTLQEAAYHAAARAGCAFNSSVARLIENETIDLRGRAAVLRRHLAPQQKYLRGLFSGGTLATEALWIWKDLLGDVLSNVPLDARCRLGDLARSEGNCALDLGEEEFTVGRPHPMIDYDLRVRRLLQEAADPEVAVIVLDVVLGYGAHPDPARELAAAIVQTRGLAGRRERGLLFVASVTGTDQDPQGLARQVKALQDAGVAVCSCNAAAARLAGMIVAPLTA